MSVVVDRKHINSLKKADEVIDQIFDEHEVQFKAKNEKIERLTIRLKLIKEMSDVNEKIINDKDEEIKELGEIVQQYLIPSKNYDAIIRDKDEEIVKLKLELFRSSPKIANKKSRSIVAMLFWRMKRAQRNLAHRNIIGSLSNKVCNAKKQEASFAFSDAIRVLKDNQ